MTEVPEHLLRRARERRAALTGGAASDPASAPAEGGDTPAVAATGASAVPAPVEPTEAVPAVPEPTGPSATYIREQAVRRTRVPFWVAPVLLVLPFWAILYAGAFADRTEHEVVDPLELGAELYRAQGCSSCHGGRGEGGTGPALAGESVEQTFPQIEDHVAWVKSGSIGTAAAPEPYGSPDRPGGQRQSRGGMPGFGSRMTEEQIAAVVQYERERL
jgi:mono/diheme cytochrome c family protein